MRVSKYNIYIKLKHVEHTWLIIQGTRGSFDLVDDDIIAILKEGEKNSEVLVQISQEQREILNSRGYITELSEEEEFKFIETISRTINTISRKGINVTLLPTYNCNFRCEYCFERNLQKKGSKLLGMKMSTEIVDAVFEQLRKYKEESIRLEGIYLFGGEPLLLNNMDIVTYICEKAKSYSIPISCISNGYDLHHYIDFIKKYNFISVQITVDGIQSEHDRRRFLTGGQGTYDRIINNVDKALVAGVPIVLRTNVNRKNIESINDLINLYEKKGWTKKENFRYYFKSTLRCYEEMDDELSDVELMKLLAKSFGETPERFNFNSIYGSLSSRLNQMLSNKGFAPMRSGYCGANMGMYTVDPYGDIYPCWDMLTEEECVIGCVDTKNKSFVFNDTHRDWKERTVDRIDDCKQCKYMLFCGGGCAAQAKIMNNNMNKVFCDDFQVLFDEVASDVCEDFLSKMNEVAQA